MDARITALADALALQYRIEREVGEGGMATVLLAEDLRHGRKVAIKVLKEALSASLGQERFEREIRVVATLQHPHVLPLFDSGQAAGQLYYVMPFVDGESLRQRLAQRGALPLDDAVRILQQVADALSEAHRHGIVHRDLKPDNVLVRGRHALVADFGVAKALNEATAQGPLTSLGLALGTPAYMAPEQALADPQMDHRADVYAFGVLAYEVLTGETPFAGRTPQETLAAHITVPPAPVASRRLLPPPLAQLVMRCLEKRPEDRPQQADEIVRLLETLSTSAEQPAPVAAPVPPAPSADRPTKRPVGRRIAIALVVAASAAVGLWTRGAGARAGQSADANAATTIDQVAVLPFENIGGDTGTVYLADGMTDEVANALTKVPGLKVASRTSSYAYRDARTRQLAEIGRTLAVRAVLEGTVSRAADQVRISARLTRTEDGVEIWSDAFVRPVRDVFAMQHDVGKAIVVALGGTLGVSGATARANADTTPGTTDAEAYDLYLRGMHAWRQRDTASLQLAEQLFTRAQQRDTAFARAYAGLALVRFSLSERGQSGPGTVDSIENAAREAIRRDSTLSEPWQVLGFLYSRTLRLRASDQAFRRAITLDPRAATAYHWFGFALYTHLRAPDSALALITEARRLDPLSAIISANYATIIGAAGQVKESDAAFQRAFELNGADPNVLSNRVASLGGQNRCEEMTKALATFERRVGNIRISSYLRWMAHCLAQRGDTAGALRLLTDNRTKQLALLSGPLQLAEAYAEIGRGAEALKWLSAAAERSPYRLPSVREIDSIPLWAPIRPLPGFAELRRRIVAYENAPVTLP